MTDTLHQRKTLPLPREVRDKVYRHLFSERCDIVLGNGPFVSPRSNRPHPAIFRVSKSTGEEALSGFYKETTFRHCITFSKKYKHDRTIESDSYRPNASQIRHVEMEPSYDGFGRVSEHIQQQLCDRSINLFSGNYVIRHSLLVKYQHVDSFDNYYPNLNAYSSMHFDAHKTFFEALKNMTGFRVVTIEIRLLSPSGMNFFSMPEPTTKYRLMSCVRAKEQIRKDLEPTLGPAIERDEKNLSKYPYTRYLEFHPQDFLEPRNGVEDFVMGGTTG